MFSPIPSPCPGLTVATGVVLPDAHGVVEAELEAVVVPADEEEVESDLRWRILGTAAEKRKG